MKGTLGLTGLTMNAMALIAPGAFLWLTFAQQCQYGAPMAGSAIWFGIVAALALCFATAISYAELAKLFPGAGSSYFFAEQAFLSKTHAYKFARVAKFLIGWSSHLYYWVYPGVMVGVTAILVGYVGAQLFPSTFNGSIGSPLLMVLFCLLFAFGVAYIAYRGVTTSTSVNVAVNVIQITALLVFAGIAIGYRVNHKEGDPGWALVDGKPSQVQPVWEMEEKKDEKTGQPIPKEENGKPVVDEKGQPVFEETEKLDDKGNKIQAKDKGGKLVFEPVPPVSYKEDVTEEPLDPKDPSQGTKKIRQCFASADAVVSPHGFSYLIIQACIAILILVGFESVTAMSEEARNAKRDVPRAVLLSLFIQGVVCYLIQYFAAEYFLHNNYRMTDAAGSSAPIADMMQLVGAWMFGSPEAGWWFMLVQAITVFLALIGTTLSSMNTGARVTYAMGRDEEVPSHFGLLHGKTLTPHRAIWTLAAVSAAVGIFAVLFYACGPFVTDVAAAQKTTDDIRENFRGPWYSFGIFDGETAKRIPNSLLVVTLTSNFGTFLLYMLTNLIAIVAFVEHRTFNTFKHVVIPLFGLVANLVCMLFYLIGPWFVTGMSWKESYLALGVAAVWGIYGVWYFRSTSRTKGRTTLVGEKPEATLTSSTAP
jgi:basic amino acid/polyamine antiporter, APA family